ncbi:hypothetical protein B0H13DRAFT_2277198 [Mycena leptocephala]|nr:hypothetical protein B0H13DRAFT_2277198 [Mycena leptocephala]
MSQSMCRLVVIMESEAEGRGSRKRALETAPEATYGGAWVYALSTPTLDSWYRDRRAVATSVSTTFTSHLSSLTTRQFRLFSPLLPRPLAAPLADKCVPFGVSKAALIVSSIPAERCYLRIPEARNSRVPGSRFGVRARKASVTSNSVQRVIFRTGDEGLDAAVWRDIVRRDPMDGSIWYSNTWIWATEYKKGAENSLHLAGHKWAVLSI